jgi:hypothetical protein
VEKFHWSKQLFPGLVIGALLSLTGCSTIFGENNRIVNIHSAPKGAKVVMNNMVVNDTTPTKVVITNMFAPTLISVEKHGCKPQQIIIEPEFQKVGWWNVLVLPGFVVDAVTGDMMKIPEAQHTFNVRLCQH